MLSTARGKLCVKIFLFSESAGDYLYDGTWTR